MSRLDNRAYYDDFAGWYERERHLPYHRMLDDLEVELVARYATGKQTLEVGCGTGLILHRVAELASEAHGIDLSAGMLAHAAARGLGVAQASATALPLADASVDVAICLSSIRHVRDRTTALRELRRVVRPGGTCWIVELDPAASAGRIANHADRLGSALLRAAFGPLVVRTAPRAATIEGWAISAGWSRRALRDDPVQPVYILELA